MFQAKFKISGAECRIFLILHLADIWSTNIIFLFNTLLYLHLHQPCKSREFRGHCHCCSNSGRSKGQCLSVCLRDKLKISPKPRPIRPPPRSTACFDLISTLYVCGLRNEKMTCWYPICRSFKWHIPACQSNNTKGMTQMVTSPTCLTSGSSVCSMLLVLIWSDSKSRAASMLGPRVSHEGW